MSPAKQFSELSKKMNSLLPEDMPVIKNRKKDARNLLNDLEAHQIELEVQNRTMLEIQQNLEDSRNRFARLYECIPVCCLTLDAAGAIRELNPAGEKLLGHSREKLTGKPFSFFVRKEDRRKLFRHLKRCEQSWHEDKAVLCLEMEEKKIWTSMTTHASKDRASGSLVYDAVVLNITQQVEGEVKLKKSEDRVRRIIETASDAFVEIDSNGAIAGWNLRAEKLFGWTREETIGLNAVEAMVSAKEKNKFNSTQKEIFLSPDGMQPIIEMDLVRRNGSEFPAEMTVWPLRTDEGESTLNLFIRDVSERRRVESEVQNINFREQQKIGQDLHDSICQELAGAAYMAKVLEQNLEKKSLPEAHDVKKILELIYETIGQTRNLARGLVAWDIDTNGLGSALVELGSGIQKTYKIHCQVDYDQSLKILNPAAAKHLFRIAQIQAAAAVKRRTSKIHMELLSQNHRILLRVTDNSLTPQITPESIEYRVIKYRAALIHALVEFHKRKTGGVVLECSFTPELAVK